MGTLKSTFRKLTIRAVMFLLYLFIGAGIFLAIEKNAVSQKLKEQRWLNVTLQFRIAHNITEEEFRKLEEEMKQAVKDNVTLSWSYVNAFLFCYNVITTIGKFQSQFHKRLNSQERWHMSQLVVPVRIRPFFRSPRGDNVKRFCPGGIYVNLVVMVTYSVPAF